MKTVKIIIGGLLLYGAGAEYINASKQLSSFVSPGIIMACLVMISLSAWLIGSGLSKDKFEIRSFQFLKYFFLSILGFVAFAFFSLISYTPEQEIITSNGVKVNISKFMEGSKNIIPDEAERREYCKCMVDKLTADGGITNDFYNELKNGDIDKIILSLQSGPGFAKFGFPECMSDVKNFRWTETIEETTRRSIYEEVRNSELSKTNDIDRYCDCMISEYKKLPMNELTDPGFYNSQNRMRIDSLCRGKSELR